MLRCFCPTFDSISVIAIGGYGRKERALYSDIDLLFLAQNDQLLNNQKLFEYIDVLQSLPVRIGYCTHNFDSLITYANNDVHLLTALIDAFCSLKLDFTCIFIIIARRIDYCLMGYKRSSIFLA